MSVATARERARIAVNARMTDACTIRRVTGETVDDNTGVITPTWASVYTGPCRMKQPAASASAHDAGEAAVLLQQPQLHLPMTAPNLPPGAEVTITASQGDPLLVGRVFLVRSVPAYSDASARRFGVTERTA